MWAQIRDFRNLAVSVSVFLVWLEKEFQFEADDNAKDIKVHSAKLGLSGGLYQDCGCNWG